MGISPSMQFKKNMMRLHGNRLEFGEVTKILTALKSESLAIDISVFNIVLASCGKLQNAKLMVSVFSQLFDLDLKPNEETFSILLDPAHYDIKDKDKSLKTPQKRVENANPHIRHYVVLHSWLRVMLGMDKADNHLAHEAGFDSLPSLTTAIPLTWMTKKQILKWFLWTHPNKESIYTAFDLLLTPLESDSGTADFVLKCIESLIVTPAAGPSRTPFFLRLRAKLFSTLGKEKPRYSSLPVPIDSHFEEACLVFMRFYLKSQQQQHTFNSRSIYPSLMNLVRILMVKKGIAPPQEADELIAKSLLIDNHLSKAQEILTKIPGMTFLLKSAIIRCHLQNNDTAAALALVEEKLGSQIAPSFADTAHRSELVLVIKYLIQQFYRGNEQQISKNSTLPSQNDLILRLWKQFYSLGISSSQNDTKAGPTSLYNSISQYFIDTKQLDHARRALMYSLQDRVWVNKKLWHSYVCAERLWRPDLLPWNRYPIATVELGVEPKMPPTTIPPFIGNSKAKKPPHLPKTLKDFDDVFAFVPFIDGSGNGPSFVISTPTNFTEHMDIRWLSQNHPRIGIELDLVKILLAVFCKRSIRTNVSMDFIYSHLQSKEGAAVLKSMSKHGPGSSDLWQRHDNLLKTAVF